MLTPEQEKWVRDHAPTPRAPQPAVRYTERKVSEITKWWDDMLAQCRTKMKTMDISEDDGIESRVKHAMLKGEKLGEFYSRVGLGKAQILAMSKAEITRAVELAEQRNAEDGFQTQTIRKAEPKKSQIPIHGYLMPFPPQ